MENIKESVGQMLREIDEVVELFYQQKTQEAYTKLDPVLEKFMTVIEQIVAYQKEHTEVEFDITGLTEALKEALSALEERDAILMADVLKYDIMEKLEAVVSAL